MHTHRIRARCPQPRRQPDVTHVTQRGFSYRLAVNDSCRVTERKVESLDRVSSSQLVWALLDQFRTSSDRLQGLKEAVLVGSAWMTDEV